MSTHLPRVPSIVLATLLVAALALVAPSSSTAAGGRHRPASADRVVTVHPIGDSITFGASSPTVPGGYRSTLSTVLAKDDITARYVGTSVENAPVGADPLQFAHDGWNGERIDELAASLAGPTDLGGGYWLTGSPTRAPIRADVTVVMAGVNDIVQRYDPAHPAAAANAAYDPTSLRTFAADAGQRLRQLVKSVHRLDRHTAIVLCTNPPIADTGANPAYGAEANRVLNREIRGNVYRRLERQGVPIVLADVEADFRSAGGGEGSSLMGDVVHPSAGGYAVLGRSVARAVRKLTARR